jgi:integrase
MFLEVPELLRRWSCGADLFRGDIRRVVHHVRDIGRRYFVTFIRIHGYWRALQEATTATGIGGLGTHSFRHTYRSWLDAVGTSITVQQKLMRHSDIRTTLNIYGDVVTEEMEQADSKVAALALKSDSKVIPAVVSH